MKTRITIITFLAFFAFVPSVFAAGSVLNGGLCRNNGDCVSGYCNNLYTCAVTNGVTLLPNGSSCTNSTKCASGFCSDSQVCDVRPNTVTGGGNVSPTTYGGGNITGGTGQNVTLINPLGSRTDLMTLINEILAFVVRIGAIVVILMLVYVGFLFVSARGEPGKITTARQALMWTIVGALILLGAQVISLGIQATVQALSVGG